MSARQFTSFQKVLIISFVFVVLGAFIVWRTFGAAEIGVTLTTNPDLENGLVGHWTFDGSDVDVSSTTGEIIDRKSSVRGDWLAHSSTTAPGVLGQALAFPGVSSYITVPQIAAYKNVPLTISQWLYIDPAVDLSAIRYALRLAHSVSPYAAYAIGVDSTSKFICRFYESGGTNHTCTADAEAQKGRWYNVLCMLDASGNGDIYIDGVQQVDTCDSPSLLNADGTLRIGGSNGSGIDWHGYVDDTRIYSRVLSQSEITRLYGLGATTRVATTLFTNPNLESGLVGHWTFDGDQMDWSSTTAEVRDRSGQQHHGNTETSMSSLLSTAPGVVGQALSFDGSNDFTDVGAGPASVSTLAFWLRTTQGTTDIIDINGSDYVHLSSGTLTATGFTGTVYIDGIQTTAYPGDGAWHHVTVTMSAQNASDLDIGRRESSTYLMGSLDDVRIYNRALSAEEVKRLYGLGATTRIATTLTTNPSLETGLVGHWTFDGPDVDWSASTAEIKDKSGEGNHGNAGTGITAQAAVSGVMGQGIDFVSPAHDGIAADGGSGAVDGITRLTLAAWIRPRSRGELGAGRIVSKGFTTRGWQWFMGNNHLTFKYEWNSEDVYWSSASDSITYNEWQHVVVTYHVAENVSPVFYVDGVQVGSESTVATGTPGYDIAGDTLYIGQRSTLNTAFDGLMDDVRIYDRLMSAEDVRRLYELGR